jgi:hypothetical protein
MTLDILDNNERREHRQRKLTGEMSEGFKSSRFPALNHRHGSGLTETRRPEHAQDSVTIRRVREGWVVWVADGGQMSCRSFNQEMSAANYAAGQRLLVRQRTLSKNRFDRW